MPKENTSVKSSSSKKGNKRQNTSLPEDQSGSKKQKRKKQNIDVELLAEINKIILKHQAKANNINTDSESSEESENELPDQANENNFSEESDSEEAKSEEVKEDTPTSSNKINEVETSEDDEELETSEEDDEKEIGDQPNSGTKIDEVETSEDDEELETSEEEDEKEVEEGKPTSSNKINEAEESAEDEDEELESSEEENEQGETSKSEEKIVNKRDSNQKTEQSDNKNDKDALDEKSQAHKILVRNISRLVSETVLRQLFSKYGEVEQITVKEQGSKSWFCEIMFKKRKAAQKALELHGLVLKGHHLLVYKHGVQTFSVVNSVSIKCGIDLKIDPIWNSFEVFGVISSIRKFAKLELAVITFESADSVEIALKTGEVTIENKKYSLFKTMEKDIPPSLPQTANKDSPKKVGKRQKKPMDSKPQLETFHKPKSQTNYQQRPTGPRNYSNQQYTRPYNSYNRGRGQFRQPYQSYNSRGGHQGQFRSYQSNRGRGSYGGRGGFRPQQPAEPPKPKLEDIIGPGLLVHKDKFGPNTFTIGFKGNTHKS